MRALTRRHIPRVATLLGVLALAAPAASHAAEPLVITSVDVPATTTSNEITVTPNVATVGDTACVYMRIANEDGNWPAGGFGLNGCRAQKHILSVGDGIKGVYVQVQGAKHIGNDQYVTVESNIVFVKLRKLPAQPAPQPEPQPQPQPQPEPQPQPQPAGPIVLESVVVPATMTSSEFEFVQNYHGGQGCMSIRTATEDGNWNGWMDCKTRNRSTASAGLGTKGLFVQLKGSDGSLSEIKFTKYQVIKDAAGGNPTPQPGPDKTAPTLSKVTVTTKSPSRFATINLTATDNVGVTQARLANEDGTWGAWQTYKPAMPQTMSAGKGYKGVFVQLRDAAGNVSTITYTKFTVA